jgi:hypothetical protein
MTGVPFKQVEPEPDDGFADDRDVNWQEHAQAAAAENDISFEQNGQGNNIPFYFLNTYCYSRYVF